MKCSNLSCRQEFNEPANRLGECPACHAKHAPRINTGMTRFSESMVRWIGEVEAQHDKTIFYSDEFKKQDKAKFVVTTDQVDASLGNKAYGVSDDTRRKVVTLQSHLQRAPSSGGYVVSSLPSELVTMLSWNGVAEGFVGASKNFYLMNGRAPSDAIRSFVRGRLTVCECEGVATVVFLNAICDLLGDKVFDLAFSKLSIVGTSASRHNKSYIDKQLAPGSDSIQVGDWIYFSHTKLSLEKFQDLVQKNRRGGAASGWNLVCVEGSGPDAKYLGFGMSNHLQGMTLAAIQDAMIKDCGGDPKARGWDMEVVFRIRPNLNSLANLAARALAPPTL